MTNSQLEREARLHAMAVVFWVLTDPDDLRPERAADGHWYVDRMMARDSEDTDVIIKHCERMDVWRLQRDAPSNHPEQAATNSPLVLYP